MREKIHYDDFGTPYVLDEKGNKRPPMQLPEPKKTTGGWAEYDTSQGHCGLCGKLTCRGGCFM